MRTSFREIAHSIDRLYPPQSIRELARRFRYTNVVPGGLPIEQVSLRSLGARVSGETTKKLEFLNYNTWLMRDNFKLADLIKAIGGWNRFCICMGLNVVDLLAGVLEKVGTSGICEAFFKPEWSLCGVLKTPAYAACKALTVTLGQAGKLAAFLIRTLGIGIDAIFDILEVPFNVVADVACRLLGKIIPAEIHLVDVPDLDERVSEIGDQVFNYDLVSLNEVWRPEHKDNLLSHGPEVTILTGPPDPKVGAWEHMGSGLLVFSPTFRIEDGGIYQYRTAGTSHTTPGGCDFGKMVDADHWARKGIQRTLVDVGFGFIELYSTHLYSGGDMPDELCFFFGGPPEEEEKRNVRKAQIDELAQFVARTHDPRNVAIIAGDFNVGILERAGLLERLGWVDGLIFDDWYSLPVFTEVYPKAYPDGSPCDPAQLGHTSRDGENDTFDAHCKYSDKLEAPVHSQHDYYCDERIPPDVEPNGNVKGERLDLILIQRPVMSHTFNLDVSRIRRRAFKRFGEHPQSRSFMSDHLGLEVSLFISPR